MAKDPVCGMTVDENSPAATVNYKGQTYYFCHQNCVDQFNKDPKKYVPKDK